MGADVSLYDFWDTYLPQYEAAFTKGGASGAMCSYMAANNVSSCGSNWLMNELIRDKWNRPDAVVMSDCSAVGNMMKNVMKLNGTQAAAQAMNAGLDVYGGWDDDLWTDGHLHTAVTLNETSEATITKAVERTFMQKMKVGLFDPLEGNPWRNLTLNDMNSTHAQTVAYEAALQSFVLLKNEWAVAGKTKVLPFKLGMKVAVVGPMSNDAAKYNSDYAAAGMPQHSPSIADAVFALNEAHGGSTTTAQGVDINSKDTSHIAAAVSLVEAADITILVLGISKAEEHEGIDRKDTLLPGQQTNFSLQVLAAAKKKGAACVVVLISGGILSIDELIAPAPAIVDAFNPAQAGPTALAHTLFGLQNRWGKLPVTIYPGNYSGLQRIQEMSLTTGPGRSYRYYTGTPLFAFGEGLSYTDFTMGCDWRVHDPMSFVCTVKNVGGVTGDEVVQVYHSVSAEIKAACQHPVPIKKLVGFERVTLQPNEEVPVMFDIMPDDLFLVNATGDKVLYPGTHLLTFSRGNGETVTIQVPIA